MTGLPGLDWIAVDWGTSNLRVWAMDGAGRVLAHAESDRGMAKLDRAGFEPALLALVAEWLPPAGQVPCVACGMVGSRQGWVEAPYRAVPCPPFGHGAPVAPPTQDRRLAVRVIPGLKQERPADVMRGEETQIAGYLTKNPGFDGVLCLPGTHTKWVRISAGEVVSFQTFMTGELFALLSQQSVLRHSVGEGWDDAAFAEAVAEGISHPARIAAGLFTIRAEALLHGLSPAAARARLSGLLVGIELAGARPYWLGLEVAIIGAETLAHAYAAALKLQGVASVATDVSGMTLAGLSSARMSLRERVA